MQIVRKEILMSVCLYEIVVQVWYKGSLNPIPHGFSDIRYYTGEAIIPTLLFSALGPATVQNQK